MWCATVWHIPNISKRSAMSCNYHLIRILDKLLLFLFLEIQVLQNYSIWGITKYQIKCAMNKTWEMIIFEMYLILKIPCIPALFHRQLSLACQNHHGLGRPSQTHADNDWEESSGNWLAHLACHHMVLWTDGKNNHIGKHMLLSNIC